MNWFDLVVIIVVLIFTIISIKRGFLLSVLDVFSFFVNLVISLFLAKPMRGLLDLFGMESGIAGKLYTHYSGFGEDFTVDLIEYSKNGNITDFVNDAINTSPMNSFGKKLFNGTINNNLSEKLASSSNETVSLADIMSKSLAQFITVVSAFLICFILVYVVLIIIKLITKKITQSKFVNTFDKLFGACFGVVKGFLFWVAIFVVLSFFSDNGILSSVIGYINQSAIGGWLRSNVNTFMLEYVNIKQFIIDILNKV